ncbi:MAG: cytochrome c oxidase accessory protein CcoG [Gammaproteobacteria bacterium]|nr:cytochrome c oxidase accessory protein CcoG [Gammaproteobacteria bacterium]
MMNDEVREELYARRQQIYPREVHGVFARWRVIMVVLTLGIYYGLPWISWGEGRQAFLIDLPGRKFHLFFWTFWPQDLFYLAAVLIIAALSLFLFTAIAGRLWCGYTCPQTVWTEVFLWIERHIEGGRLKQMKLAASAWNRDKVLKKGAKHLVWILLSLWTGFTFVGYFTSIRELVLAVTQVKLGPWETFWILFYGFTTYGNAGFLREQVCLYMCPYARFQGVMYDRDTLVISYDKRRGEPRGALKRADDTTTTGLGDCIDCTLCVQVCPTGIDIRNGLQIECIACGACLDACDTVMQKVGYPKGLIRYSSQNEMEQGTPRQLLRPRILIYGAALASIATALITAVLLRVPLDLDVIRDRNALYRETPDGLIENVYTLKILNKDTRDHRYLITAGGIQNLVLGIEHNWVSVASGEVVEIPARLQADVRGLHGRSTVVRFALQAQDEPMLRKIEEARFLGPAS